jgi:hypothetical protein
MDPALTAWLAGVITWACAALVDLGEREVKFKGDRRFVEGQIAGGSLKANEVGELDQYAANKFGRGTLRDSLGRTYAEPLFVCIIVAWTTMSGEYVGWTLLALTLATVAIVGVKVISAPAWMRRRVFVAPLWLGVLVVLGVCRWVSRNEPSVANLLACSKGIGGVVGRLRAPSCTRRRHACQPARWDVAAKAEGCPDWPPGVAESTSSEPRGRPGRGWGRPGLTLGSRLTAASESLHQSTE